MNISEKPRYIIKPRMSATQIIIIGFLAVIICGTILLTLPISSNSGTFTSVETAAFTAVSATCVTGLVIEDTVLYWSIFGQVVIICLIQIGGLGFMTMAVLLSIMVKRTITPRERVIMAQALGLNTNEGIVKLVRRILYGTLLIELSGAVMLSTQFIPVFGWGSGIGKGIFHSISAFCNAGFDLMGRYSGAYSSLGGFRSNVVVNVTIMLLIVIGGIGFLVWDDVVEYIKKRRRFSVYTKFVIMVTMILIIGGASLIMAFEYNNPETMQNLPIWEKILASFFQSVTTRTAGFGTIDNTFFTDSTKIVSILLMFIGGASGSTAGGVKVATFGLIVYSVIRAAMGENEIILYKRKISNSNVLRAMAITFVAFTMVLTSSFIISLSDGVQFLDALYESVSAMATVGLSLSLTPVLSTLSHITLMILMFFGRVGILTITFSIMLRITAKKSCITYPETQMLIG